MNQNRDRKSVMLWRIVFFTSFFVVVFLIMVFTLLFKGLNAEIVEYELTNNIGIKLEADQFYSNDELVNFFDNYGGASVRFSGKGYFTTTNVSNGKDIVETIINDFEKGYFTFKGVDEHGVIVFTDGPDRISRSTSRSSFSSGSGSSRSIGSSWDSGSWDDDWGYNSVIESRGYI